MKQYLSEIIAGIKSSLSLKRPSTKIALVTALFLLFYHLGIIDKGILHNIFANISNDSHFIDVISSAIIAGLGLWSKD